MSKKFSLKVLAADKIFYEGEAVSLVIPIYDGFMQILADHEPMVIATIEGLIRFRTEDKSPEQEGLAGVGMVRIDEGKVTVLVDSIERPEEIDAARAREALERAKEQLRQDQSIQEYRISQANLARAMMRLSHAGQSPDQLY